MAPYSEFQESAPCQYFEHMLSTKEDGNCLTWRVVHCKKPAISAIEILDTDGNVIATAHTIGASTVPTEEQVTNPLKVPTYNPKTERLFLIRGASKDFAILKASWSGFVKSGSSVKGKLGYLQLNLFKLGEVNGRWINIWTDPADPFYWPLYEPNGYRYLRNYSPETNGYVDLKQSIIRISKNSANVPENICIATTISMAFVLCQPRPPPPRDSKNAIAAYPPPPEEKPGILNLDEMKFLIASGLYASTLPRWYHTKCSGGYFYQIHPYFYRHPHYNLDHHDYDTTYFINRVVKNEIFDYGTGVWGDVNDKTGGCGGRGGCGDCDDGDKGCEGGGDGDGGCGGCGGDCGGCGGCGGCGD